ncbi:TonB-dependent receptor [Desertivirga brevis]|uniref:TonB-dependent receptor n=1 Tax=Desertivirga brevis TaxID=2810310 RepID=UPI001A975898|nr:TonB-dependent receptor [Pedobacter sp. SYSU D00873]
MKLLSLPIITITLLLITFKSFGQITYSISGKVVNEQNVPLDYISVSLLNKKDSSLVKTILSDEQGGYRFAPSAQGSYLIMANSVGLAKTYSSPVTIDSAQKSIVIPALVLVKESKTLKAVTITAQKPFIERKADRLVVNVEASPSSAGNTALEVLQKSPGVSIDKDDNISMNGKNSVLIMIDGKPTYMSSADVANMLRSMQSNQIETIELITNPSAKYDAAGNAGIINIKTKRNKNLGFNGTFNAGTGYGKTSKYNTGTNLNFRKNKINVFGNYNYSNNGNISRFNLIRVVEESNEVTHFNQNNGWDGRRSNNSYKAGIDFFATKKTTLGLMINGYDNSVDEDAISGTDISFISPSSVFKPAESINVNGRNNQRYTNSAFNFNAKTTIDTNGREITFDADYSTYKGKLDEFRDNFYSRTNATSRPVKSIHNLAPADINIVSAKIDYTHPFSKTLRLEAGLKSSYVRTDNNFRFDTLQNNIWITDRGRSNHFIYDENINAAYFNLNKQFKKTTVQIGLRAEQTYSKGNSITQDSVIERDYLNYFPSASISQKLGKDHQVGLSFSRRIDRPNYNNLNPFIYILDDYTYEQGNPYLRPQFTNSTDLSYTFKSVYTLTLNYSRTNNVIAQITEQDDKTKITLAQERNLSSQTVYSVNFFTPIQVAKWWKINNNTQVFNMGFKSALLGSQLDVNQTVFQINSDNQFTINKKTSADLSFWYMSPLRYSIFEINNTPAFNVGLKRSFNKDKMSLRANVNDIFNMRENRGKTNYANMNLNFSNKWESRVFNLSLSYKFGNSNIKPERNRNTGLDAEANRMKN